MFEFPSLVYVVIMQDGKITFLDYRILVRVQQLVIEELGFFAIFVNVTAGLDTAISKNSLMSVVTNEDEILTIGIQDTESP